MHRQIKKFFRELKAITMTTAEREHVREALFSHMEKNPAAEDAIVRRMLGGAKGFTRTVQPVPIFIRFAPALAVLLVISGAGGVSLAAEGAVPGEVLYPVKIHVNETVRSVLTTRPDQKVAWEAERVERRIREAETLAARGELTEEHSVTLAESVEKHSQALATSMRILEAEGDALALVDAGVDASLILEGHDDVLLGIVTGTMGMTDGDEEVERILKALRATEQALEKVRLAVEEAAEAAPIQDQLSEEAAPTTPPPEIILRAESRHVRAEKGIAKARAYLTEHRDELFELIVLQAGRIIRTAEEQLHLGENHLAVGEYLPAAEEFLEAQRFARRAYLLAETNVTLDVEIDIEMEEVPVIEGEEEPVTEEGAPPAEETPPAEGESDEPVTTEEGPPLAGEDPAAEESSNPAV